VAQSGTENEVGNRPGRAPVAARERMNPVQSPDQVSRKVERRLSPVLVDIFTNALHMLCYVGSGGRLVRGSTNNDGPCSIVPSACVDVLDGKSLKPLNRTWPQFEPIPGFVHEAHNLVELKEAIPGLQLRLLLKSGVKLMGSGATIALDVRPSHVQPLTPQQPYRRFPW
jgi:hypothetical protein